MSSKSIDTFLYEEQVRLITLTLQRIEEEKIFVEQSIRRAQQYVVQKIREHLAGTLYEQIFFSPTWEAAAFSDDGFMEALPLAEHLAQRLVNLSIGLDASL